MMRDPTRTSEDGSDLLRRLRHRLEPALLDLLESVVKRSAETSLPTWLVGGPVRDLVLERPITDLDVVIEGDGIGFAEQVADRTGYRMIAHERFGTATLKTDEGPHLDIASARQERYPAPGALPEVMAGEIEDDLRRRDFTINAMAVQIGPGEGCGLLDPLNGAEDLKAGTIRTLHESSFTDDPTRILRAVRFAARFGFALDERTAASLDAAVQEGALRTVSEKRLGVEVGLLLGETDPQAGLDLFQQLSLWERLLGRAWHPPGDLEGVCGSVVEAIDWYLKVDHVAEGEVPSAPDRRVVLWLRLVSTLEESAARERTIGFQLGKRARRALTELMTRAEGARVVLEEAEPSDSALHEALDELGPDTLAFLVSSAGGPGVRERVGRFLQVLRGMEPWVTGHDLEELGIPERAERGDLLRALFHDQLDGRLDSRAEAIEEAKRRISRR